MTHTFGATVWIDFIDLFAHSDGLIRTFRFTHVAIDAAIAASDASEAQLKVGAIGRDISGAGLAVLRKAGLIDLCVYSGIHSIGTSEFEPPILTSVSDFVLPNNSFLSIDVPLFMAPWGGFRIETGYQISESGITRFSKTAPAYIEK